MKPIILFLSVLFLSVLFLAVLSFSCTSPVLHILPEQRATLPSWLLVPDTPERLYHAVVVNIRYRAEQGDHWQMPDETLDLGSGDCEDIAILTAYAIRERFVLDTGMMVITRDGKGHAVPTVSGQPILEAMPIDSESWTIREIIPARDIIGGM